MKYLFLSFSFVLVMSNLFAQQAPIMVSNSDGSVSNPYTTVLDAYNAANNGDIIYLPSGGFTFPDITKEIKIYGVGANPDSSLVSAGLTTISNSFKLLSNNITIEGIQFFGDILIGDGGTTQTYNGMKLNYCKFNNIYGNAGRLCNSQVIGCYILGYIDLGTDNTLPGWNNGQGSNQGFGGNNNYLSNCVMGMLQHTENSIVKNCIFNSVSWPGGLNIVYNTTIDNCIFITNQIFNDNGGYASWYNSQFNSISNCYYLNTGPMGYNNLFGCTQYTVSNSLYPFDISLAGGNIPFPVRDKANISVGNPSDLGINGGLSPWNINGCVPSNPHIYYKNIANQTNGSNNLPVHIKVRATTY